MHYKKVYVTMELLVRTDGSMRPQNMIWENGASYPIDRILHITPAASLKVGGRGIRYTVIIAQKERHLFYEDGRWFVEARIP
jgi:hypothetical protein